MHFNEKINHQAGKIYDLLIMKMSNWNAKKDSH